jgi:CheY-like chemotaxis protein
MSQTDFLPTPYEPPYPDDAPVSPHEADRLTSLLPAWLYNVADRPVVAKDMRTVPNVLIVDDDQSIGHLLSMLLLDAGFQAKVVQNAEDAFQAACDDQPALMLIDFMMPNGNGDTLICRLQAHDATRHIPLALMSSARPRLAHMQGIPFLPKPFDNDDLIEFVRCHVRVSAGE